jgi:hypothetical protein
MDKTIVRRFPFPEGEKGVYKGAFPATQLMGVTALRWITREINAYRSCTPHDAL